MADNRKPYTVNIGGVEHTLLLTEEDAARYGDAAVQTKAVSPSNKSSTPKNK